MTVQLSIFDVDRTVTRLPTYSPFLLFAARRMAPWRLLLVPALVPHAIAYGMRRISRRRMKETMHALMLGRRLPRHRAETIADAFAEKFVATGIYPQARDLIRTERAAGRRVVLATAASAFYVAPLARRLGVADVVATGGTWCDEHLTHRIAGENCYGAAKLSMIEAFLATRGIARDRAHIRFYSDHASDLPTFEWADEAVAVNPSPRLKRIALARGWPIFDWRI